MARRVITLRCYGCAAILWLALALSASGRQPANGAAFEAQFNALIERYQVQIGPLIHAEAERERRNAKYDPVFWNQIFALGEQFDKEFLPLLKAANQVDPAESLLLYLRWERAQQLTGSLDPDPKLVAQIEGVGASFDKAIPFLMDKLVKTCNEHNAMQVAPELVMTERTAQLVGSKSVTDWRKEVAECESKAVLLLDFESTIDATYGANAFPRSKAHVRADKIKLRYNPKSDQFVAEGFPLKYESYDYTLGPENLKCEKAQPVSGTVDAYAMMTRTESKAPEFVVQIFPVVSEKVQRIQLPNIPNPMAALLRHRTDYACNHVKEERGREHWVGFGVTDGAAPFRLKLGDSDVLIGTPWDMGGVHYSGATTVTLARP